MKRSLCILTVSLAAVAACSENPNVPGGPEPSSISFSYQGAVNGSFSAEHEPQAGRPPMSQTHAYGQRYQNPNTIKAAGAYVSPAGMVDGVHLRVPSHATGTFTIDGQCGWWDDTCAGITVFFGLRNANGEQARYSCTMESGTIRLTTVSATRAAGEFSGSGECLDRDAPEGWPAVTITGGRFDVKLYEASRG